jgi:hypothetical protein
MRKCEDKMAKARRTSNLSPEMGFVIDRLYERTGIPRSDILNRLVKWLGDQPQIVQLKVLGTLDDSEDTADITKAIMAEIMQDLTGGTQGKQT